MLTVNSYVVMERAVYEGTALGISKAVQNPELFQNPEKLVDELSRAVMDNISDYFEFGCQPIRISGKLQEKMWEMAKEEKAQ